MPRPRPRSRPTSTPPDKTDGIGFLMSQVGSHSASRFADRLVPLGFKPPHAGILRAICEADGASQQALG
ncbi:MarR family transcriptional regulator, partial [Singulisphaera rosea]